MPTLEMLVHRGTFQGSRIAGKPELLIPELSLKLDGELDYGQLVQS